MIFNEPLQLTIDSVAFGSSGIARKGGLVYFVADTVEGDVVEAQVSKQNKKYVEADVVKFLQSSAHRYPSPCAFSDSCGGCQWIDIDYQKQLEWKKNFLKSALLRIGKIQNDFPIAMIPSPQVLNYRHRIHLKAVIAEDQSLTIGFYKRKTRELVAIDQCQIAHNDINDFLKKIAGQKISKVKPQKFKMEVMALLKPEQGLVITIFPDPDQKNHELDKLVTYFKAFKEVRWAGLIFDVKTSPAFILEEYDDITWYVRPTQFTQVNGGANQALRKLLQDLIKQIDVKSVLDLYCGNGNLSLPLMKQGIAIEGLEQNHQAIESAVKSSSDIVDGSVTYQAGDALNYLWKCVRQKKQFDGVIVDPPREGLAKAIKPLCLLLPKHLFYISCDPSTLARDLGMLTKHGYKINMIKAFDFFPHTFHVESFVYLGL